MSETPKWYVIHTYSGYENKVASSIMKAVENRKLYDLITDVTIPVETVREVKDGKTKEMVAFQKALNLDKTAIIFMDNDNVNVIRAAQNIQNLSTLPVAQISTYEVVANAKVVLTKAAVEKIEEVYGE